MNAKLVQRMSQTWNRRQADILIADVLPKLLDHFVNKNASAAYSYVVNKQFMDDSTASLFMGYLMSDGWSVTVDKAKGAYEITFAEVV